MSPSGSEESDAASPDHVAAAALLINTYFILIYRNSHRTCVVVGGGRHQQGSLLHLDAASGADAQQRHTDITNLPVGSASLKTFSTVVSHFSFHAGSMQGYTTLIIIIYLHKTHTIVLFRLIQGQEINIRALGVINLLQVHVIYIISLFCLIVAVTPAALVINLFTCFERKLVTLFCVIQINAGCVRLLHVRAAH